MAQVQDQFGEIIRKAAVEIGGSFTNMALQVVDGSVSARSQLAQSRPADTNPVSVLTGVTCLLANVFIANTSGSEATFRIFHDNDGTTYDETTAIMYDITIRAGNSVSIPFPVMMNNLSGNLAIRSSVGNALTFTFYGLTLA